MPRNVEAARRLQPSKPPFRPRAPRQGDAPYCSSKGPETFEKVRSRNGFLPQHSTRVPAAFHATGTTEPSAVAAIGCSRPAPTMKSGRNGSDRTVGLS